jgi:carbamoylphosphate synthase large subunit
MALAADEGLRIPHTIHVGAPAELSAWLRQACLPAVIKIDGTWGGQGVAIVRTHNEARHAFDVMAARPSIGNALVRVLLDRDPSVLRSVLGNARHTVSVQAFIQGAPANRAVACWQGEVLAGISVEAISTQHPTGPATVVRVIHNPEMTVAVERLVRRLGVSGLWGVDFVLDAATGAATLIEMNPRATPICHLSVGAGQDLPVALHAQLLGQAPAPTVAAIQGETIALFPGEWRRDPASVHLHSGRHDVPWQEPELVLDGIRRPWSERGLIARLWRRLQSRTSGQLSLANDRAQATRVERAKDPSLLSRAP